MRKECRGESKGNGRSQTQRTSHCQLGCKRVECHTIKDKSSEREALQVVLTRNNRKNEEGMKEYRCREGILKDCHTAQRR